jgi:hypothetical protein
VATIPDRMEEKAERIGGVYREHLERIALVMRDHYPKVLAANRFFEEETGIHNELGSNNLNDALSHLGTLFEGAEKLTFVQQAQEVHDFEGHLRRGMMESYEQIFRQRMGVVHRLWKKHAALARPLQERNQLHGVPSLEHIASLRRQAINFLDEGREAKRGHDWEAWDRGTEALVNACKKATELSDALDAGIAAAMELRRDRRAVRTNVITALVVAAVSLPAGYLFNAAIGDDSAMVPDVRGKPLTEATTAILRARFQIVPESGRVRANCNVASQTPAPGERQRVGSVVVVRC